MKNGEKKCCMILGEKMNKDAVFAFGFITLFLGSMLAGVLTHEAFHILTMDNAHTITLHFGSIADKFVSVCCLTENESSNESTAYLIQSITVVSYFALGFSKLRWMDNPKKELKE